MKSKKMRIEIWSDIMCPFCYIGKRRFENALNQFPEKENIEVVWKSFDLYPDLETDTEISIFDFLQKYKGMPLSQTKILTQQVTDFAKTVNLDYDFDRVVVAKTTQSHQIIHLAKTKDLQNEMKERMLSAYFIEGKNIDDKATLVQLGTEVGLIKEEIENELDNGHFLNDIQKDMLQAREYGISGVPYFVLDKKYGISGAQEESSFLEVIQKSFLEWEKENRGELVEIVKGDACDADGNC